MVLELPGLRFRSPAHRARVAPPRSNHGVLTPHFGPRSGQKWTVVGAHVLEFQHDHQSRSCTETNSCRRRGLRRVRQPRWFANSRCGALLRYLLAREPSTLKTFVVTYSQCHGRVLSPIASAALVLAVAAFGLASPAYASGVSPY